MSTARKTNKNKKTIVVKITLLVILTETSTVDAFLSKGDGSIFTKYAEGGPTQRVP